MIHSTKNNRRVPFIINCLTLIKRYTSIKSLCNKLLYSVLCVLIVRFLITNIKVFFYNNTLALKYSFHFCLDPFVFDIWKVSPGIKNPICHSKWQQIFRKELANPKTAHFSPDFLSLKSCLKTSRSPYPDKSND